MVQNKEGEGGAKRILDTDKPRKGAFVENLAFAYI
jgi:hypothetical protein